MRLNKADPECCPRCGKRVYFAEQILSLGRKWHKISCFTCGMLICYVIFHMLFRWLMDMFIQNTLLIRRIRPKMRSMLNFICSFLSFAHFCVVRVLSLWRQCSSLFSVVREEGRQYDRAWPWSRNILQCLLRSSVWTEGLRLCCRRGNHAIDGHWKKLSSHQAVGGILGSDVTRKSSLWYRCDWNCAN